MWRAAFYSLGGLVATVLLLELAFQALPVSTATMTGHYFDEDVLTYPAGHRWTASTGWDLRNPQVIRCNNWGFAASRDFTPDSKAIALIGDSQVEASQLDAEMRPAVQLEAAMGQASKVYGLGAPGTALLDYAQRIRLARSQLKVNRLVVWVAATDAREALCGSGNVHSRCLDPQTLQPRVMRRPEPSGVKEVLRHSALAQYIFGQLKLRPEQVVAAMFTRQDPAEASKGAVGSAAPPAGVTEAASLRSRVVVDAVLERFFAELPHGLKDGLLFAVDGRRTGPSAQLGELDWERRYLIEQLRAGGFQVLDLEPVYAAHVARSPLSLEVGPYDRHLNALGVQLAVQAIAASLRP